MIRIYTCLMMGLTLLSCQPDELISEDSKEQDKVIESLPLIPMQLGELPANWKETKSISAHPNTDAGFSIEEGKGIIVCESNGDHFNTGIEHGDIELDIEFMVPKGSNSGIYFQGRYEVQIFDSWGKGTVNESDCGAIYNAYDEDKKVITHKGSPPISNASRAPGLWQTYNILFRAPRFDADGNKIANAKFEHVYHNGHLIQKDVEVPLPTRAHMLPGEEKSGPLMIQGDHGQVAFREIKYKKMGSDTVAISNIRYKLFDRKMDYIPDFDTMTVTKSGTAQSFDKLEDLAGQQDGFAFIFDADIDVPKDGDYLFTTMIDDGGDLFIDDKLVVHNLGEPGMGTERGLINLTKGQHTLKLTYFEEVWSALAVIYVEGPEMPSRALASTDIMKIRQSRSHNRSGLLVDATDEVEIVRGYISHKDKKETHALSVGDPSNIHYSYDLVDGTLLRAWRGEFADVTNMWQNRGQSQLLLPRNAVVEFDDGVPFAELSSESSNWPTDRPIAYQNKGYRIDASGRPVFLSTFGDVKIEDTVKPSSGGNLQRNIRVGKETGQSIWMSASKAKSIKEIAEGLISVNSDYYIKMPKGSSFTIRQNGGQDQLLLSIENEANYEIIW